MRNTDRQDRSSNKEISSLVAFFHPETSDPMTRMEAFEMLLNGNYIHGVDIMGTTHRVSLSGTTEYLEACP